MRLDKADTIFSKYIRTRDNWTCQRCARQYQPPTRALHASHFQGRGHENTRFDPDNVDAMCYGCHRYLTAHPAEHMEWQVQRKGQEKVDQLVMSSKMYCKKDRQGQYLYWKQKFKQDFGDEL